MVSSFFFSANGAAAEWRADENLFSEGRPLKPRVRPPQAATRGNRRGTRPIGVGVKVMVRRFL